ncbi:hypothetical protein [Roseicitreum antarcticum]|uniref:hypothetical protein n=1 Tax=Roseicitreum antarcticum TaxID=564137 RepID=UPI0037CA2154
MACLHGRVDGAGLALALAAHARWAAPGTLVRAGDLRLGRIAGGGVTQRLPRLIGVAATLEILLNRHALRADPDAPGPFFDRVIDGLSGYEDATLAAMLAADLTGSPAPLRPTRTRDDRLRDAAGGLAALAAARTVSRAPDQVTAAAGVIDCVEAAMLLPFDAGAERAALLAADVAQGPVALALQNLRRAELRTLRIPELRAGSVPVAAPVSLPDHLIMAGAGAALIARVLRAGFAVALWAPDGAQLQAQVEAVAALHEARLRAGQITAEALEGDWNRLSGHVDLSRLPRSPVMLGTPDLAGPMAAHLPAGGCLIQLLDADADAPGDVSVSNPVTGATPPADTAFGPDTSHTADTLPQAAGSTIAPGSVGLAIAGRIAQLVIGSGAPAGAVICAFHLAARLQLQPVRLNGRAAIPDLRATIAHCIAATRALGLSDAEIAADYIRAGLPPGFAGLPDAACATTPHPAQPFARLHAALLNACARLLQDGTAQRPSDLDLCAIRGLGWPHWRGGPCFAADLRGLMLVRREMERFGADDPALWAPQPMLRELIRNAWAFADLDEN